MDETTIHNAPNMGQHPKKTEAIIPNQVYAMRGLSISESSLQGNSQRAFQHEQKYLANHHRSSDSPSASYTHVPHSLAQPTQPTVAQPHTQQGPLRQAILPSHRPPKGQLYSSINSTAPPKPFSPMYSSNNPSVVPTSPGQGVWKAGASYRPSSQIAASQSVPSTIPHIRLPFATYASPARQEAQKSKMAVVIGASARPNSFTSTASGTSRSTTRIESPRRPAQSGTMISSPIVEVPPMSPEKLGSLRKTVSHPAQISKSLPKKKGRPFATPKAAARAAAKKARQEAHAAGIPSVKSNSSSGPPKKRGRPFRVPPAHVDVPVPEAEFSIFYCEWKDCPAELHNANTLRQHLNVVHCRRDPKTHLIPCFWKRCRTKANEFQTGDTAAATNTGNTNKFKFIKDWKEHVETAHMLPILWHQGDGPKGTDLSKLSLSSHHQPFPLAHAKVLN